MAIEGGMKCVKFLVFFFNFIFCVCGVALVAIGVLVLLALAKAPLAAGLGWSPAGVVVLGVVIFFTAFFGCCGAWRESYCMVTTVHGLVEEGLWEAVRSYEKEPVLSSALDAFQQEFSCCGVQNYTDWASVGQFGVNDTVPRSCCRHLGNPTCNVRPTPATVFEQGCLPSLEMWVRSRMVVLAAVALGIAFFEILGVVFSCCLMRGIRSGYEVM
ncbi:PREDICTED: CD63 antigen [Pseudopodoces humilis]|uniref:CD63 antigen n=1 Tax=Pseudopodoces humilis TaxID=181119 RepID=UPI0006B833E1|nr:PREDICTED: CD63 antigen [Pseudopodoces humilis]